MTRMGRQVSLQGSARGSHTWTGLLDPDPSKGARQGSAVLGRREHTD